MSAPILDRPLTDASVGPLSAAPAARRGWVALLAAGALAVTAGAGLLLGAGSDEAVLVTPTFEEGTAVLTEWGTEAAFGRPGSWVVNYVDGTSIDMRVPWGGDAVASARLGDGPIDLLTITDAAVDGEELVLRAAFDGCDYFHERELQAFPKMHVTTLDGEESVLRFDHPLFVRSPMLWQCPDRLIDRQARTRSQFLGDS